MNRHLKNKQSRAYNPMKWIQCRSLANESGVALIVALVLMLVIVTMVPAAIQLTSGEFDRTETFQEDREALAIAEAGLEHAKALVQYNTISDILDGPDDNHATISDNGTFTAGGTWPTIPGSTAATDTSKIDGATHSYTQVAFNGGMYRIRVFDNDDSALCPATCSTSETDPSLNPNFEAWVDRDGLVEIEAIGYTANQTRVTLHAKTKRRVLPTYNIPASVVLLGPVAALQAQNATFDVAGASGPGGKGYDVSGNPDAECKGVNGVAIEPDGMDRFEATNPVQWNTCTAEFCEMYSTQGKAGISGADGGTPSLQFNSPFRAKHAEAMYEDLVTNGTPDVSNTGSGPYILPAGNYGTPTNPVTLYYDDNLKIANGTNVSGNGILIVDGDLQLNGTINWNGIIMIGNCTTCTCTDCPGGLIGSGNVTVAGTILVGNSTVEASTAQFEGNAQLNYSCEGIAIANGSFKDTFAAVSWARIE
ncbi:MAG: hypothetical protein OEZ51_15145 [Nitrospinota bacterium]|nr:hypothetical protein [Nitrospinota bacterium]